MGLPSAGRNTASAAATAPGPETRTMPMAETTSPVAMAAMVSDMLKTPLKKAAPEDGFFDGMVFSRA